MNYDIFTRLLNHRVSDELARSEDFLTEVFTYLLQNSQNFFEEVINKKLAIKDLSYSNAKINAQQPLQGSRPDITLEQNDVLCLIENKILSSLGPNQLQKYQEHAESTCKKYSMILIKSRQNYIEIPEAIKKLTNFKDLSWEEDIYLLTKSLLDRNDLPQLEYFLLKSFTNLLEDLDLGCISDSEILNSDDTAKICKALNQTLSQDIKKSLLEGLPNLKIEVDVEKSGKGKAPRPILFHSFSIYPENDIWFSCNLKTLFHKTDQIKTDPHNQPVICLEYKFFTSRIEIEGKNHYNNLLKKLGIQSIADMWEKYGRPVYQQTKDEIYEKFTSLSRDEEMQKIRSFPDSGVVQHWNSTALSIAYTKESIDKHQPNGALKKYYQDIFKVLMPLLKSYGIFQIRDRFHARILENLVKK